MNAREQASFDMIQRVGIFRPGFYKSNAAKMGEWHTASHVERQPRKKKTETPKPSP